jgi:hypothetical protein
MGSNQIPAVDAVAPKSESLEMINAVIRSNFMQKVLKTSINRRNVPTFTRLSPAPVLPLRLADMYGNSRIAIVEWQCWNRNWRMAVQESPRSSEV